MYELQINALLDVRRRSGHEWTCICPYHDDTRPSLRINVRSGLWFCHGCQAAGSLERLGGVMSDRSTYDLPVFDEPGDFAGAIEEAAVYRIDDYRSAWARRGITDEGVLDDFGLGYDRVNDALTMPTSHGLIKRNLADGPKYHYQHQMRKASVLYGSELVSRPVVGVCEGPIDTLACWQAGIHAVGLLGAHMSDRQETMLREMAPKFLVLLTDDDRAGRQCATDVEERMSDVASVVWPDWRDGNDPADITEQQLRAMVDDALASIV